ncbi:hypothetical protein MPSEU_000790500 [Mayamaea pseudoterrestris]|nr:hypothetical protein MPSEU_000790500 [Mayamaea pseudoterrestris]
MADNNNNHNGDMNSIGLTLSAPGCREDLVTADETEQLLASWQSLIDNAAHSHTPVTCVNIGKRVWHPDILLKLQPFLKSIAAAVQVLLVDDVIASLKQTELGLKTFGILAEIFGASPLRVLDLNDNAIGSRGLLVLAPLFGANAAAANGSGVDENNETSRQQILQVVHQSRLEEIYLNNLGLSVEIVSDPLIPLLLPIAKQLKILDIGRNQLGSGGAMELGTRLLPHCVALTACKYGGSRPLQQGTRYLCRGLAQMVNTVTNENGGEVLLEELLLNDCQFMPGRNDDDEDEPVELLCQVLKHAKRLSKLVLSDGELYAEGTQLVFDALTISGAQLVHLDLENVEMGAEGVEYLVEWLRVSPQTRLEYLKLDTNEIGDDGLASLMAVLSAADGEPACPVLKTLVLDQNDFEADGFECLADNQIPSLEQLFLKENNEDDIDEDVLERIRNMYSTVIISDEDEEAFLHQPAPKKEEAAAEQVDAAEVDDLADAFAAGAQI